MHWADKSANCRRVCSEKSSPTETTRQMCSPQMVGCQLNFNWSTLRKSMLYCVWRMIPSFIRCSSLNQLTDNNEHYQTPIDFKTKCNSLYWKLLSCRCIGLILTSVNTPDLQCTTKFGTCVHWHSFQSLTYQYFNLMLFSLSRDSCLNMKC